MGLGIADSGGRTAREAAAAAPRTEVFIVITSARGKVAHAIWACCRCGSARARAEGCPAKGAAEQHGRAEDDLGGRVCVVDFGPRQWESSDWTFRPLP